MSAQPQDGYLAYVANLLLGSLDESAGDLTGATADYRAAVDADPSSQVAVLALAHATRRLGQRRESAEIVERLLSRDEDPLQVDGWWVFRMGPFADEYRMEQILDELRAEITE